MTERRARSGESSRIRTQVCRETGDGKLQADAESCCEPSRHLEYMTLGIDPGTATTGYGVVALTPDGEFVLLAYGVFRTAAHHPMHLRLRELFGDLQALIAEFRPQGWLSKSFLWSQCDQCHHSRASTRDRLAGCRAQAVGGRRIHTCGSQTGHRRIWQRRQSARCKLWFSAS